jgi:alanine racemase
VPAALAVGAWAADLAADRAERLAASAGGYADGMRRAAARRLDAWRAAQ